ncbi:hypothetical protein [Ferrimonas senticii]|nr:hypothetical protein [Ferrimonas senticii]
MRFHPLLLVVPIGIGATFVASGLLLALIELSLFASVLGYFIVRQSSK